MTSRVCALVKSFSTEAKKEFVLKQVQQRCPPLLIHHHYSLLMAALAHAFSNFSQALTNIAFAIMNAAIAVFHAIFQLGQELLTGVVAIFQAVVNLFLELVQDTVGFVFGGCFIMSLFRNSVTDIMTANFFVLCILGGAYYLYTTNSRTRSKGKRRA
jgi:hypothetical protein